MMKRVAALEETQRKMEKSLRKSLLILSLMGGAVACAQNTKVASLLSKDIVGIPGKEAAMMTVNLDPGASSSPHRHNAQVFVYVLQGAIVMQVRGQEQVTLHPGQTFYEGPDDVHVVGRNASTKESAKFLAFFVKDKEAPISVPER